MVIAPPQSSGFARQRATKTTSSQALGLAKVTGWVSDPEHPCTIVDDEIVVAGSSGDATVAVATTGTGTTRLLLSLRVDDVEVAQSTGTGELVWSGSLSDGQHLTLWAQRTAPVTTTIATASIDIT